MNDDNPYKDFTERLKLLSSKRPDLITIALGNIFTMRLIGNKTHGDLAEIAIAEFINQYMYDFRSIHVGKDFYRAKSKEEDIQIINEMTKDEFPVSLKAYGDGPLQLSTDKNSACFQDWNRKVLKRGDDLLSEILKDPAFAEFRNINVLPLIYDEKKQRCNILVFDYNRAMSETIRITREEGRGGRKHPVIQLWRSGNSQRAERSYARERETPRCR